MKLQFDPNQQFQHDAINSIVGLFEGQPLNAGNFSFTVESGGFLSPDGGIGNRRTIADEQIFKNIKVICKI